MYAIIEDSGSQAKVAEGDVFEIDNRDAQPGSEIEFDRVLMIGGGEGEAKVGAPYVDGAVVTAKVIEARKGEKLDVFKFKRRKGYRRKIGHRQKYLAVEITKIKG